MILATGSILLDFRLPSATTWFFLALLLAITLFFRFKRVLSLRNVDLLMLFLMAPPLLYLRESRDARQVALAGLHQDQIQFAAGIAAAGQADPLALAATGLAAAEDQVRLRTASSAGAYLRADRAVWRAYLWLLICSAYWLIRCLLDLALVRRPAFQPNLNASGLGFFGLALLTLLSLKTILPSETVPSGHSQSVLLERAAIVAAQAAEKISSPGSPLAPAGRGDGETGPAFDAAFWFRGGIATICHIIVVTGLIWIGARHFQDLGSGMAAAVLYLLLPYTAYQGWDLHHALPAALLVSAVALYRYPMVVGLLLGVASSLVFFPLVLLPVWFGFYRGRGAARFAAAVALVLVTTLSYLWFDDELRPQLWSALGWTGSSAAGNGASLPVANWRAWDPSAKPEAEGLWTGFELHYAYRLPLFIAYLALVIATAVRPAPKNLAHLIALSGALVLGIQFWYADSGGIYVLWYLPFLVLLFVRPNLAEKYPPRIEAATDSLSRAFRWLKHRLFKEKSVPQPAKVSI